MISKKNNDRKVFVHNDVMAVFNDAGLSSDLTIIAAHILYHVFKHDDYRAGMTHAAEFCKCNPDTATKVADFMVESGLIVKECRGANRTAIYTAGSNPIVSRLRADYQRITTHQDSAKTTDEKSPMTVVYMNRIDEVSGRGMTRARNNAIAAGWLQNKFAAVKANGTTDEINIQKPKLAEFLGVCYNTASAILDDLVDMGFLKSISSRFNCYIFGSGMNLIDDINKAVSRIKKKIKPAANPNLPDWAPKPNELI